MDLNKKPRSDPEKSNTIIKIKLSDMLTPPQKPDDDAIYSDSEIEEDDEDENPDEDEDLISPAEDLSSLRSPSEPENISNYPPEESNGSLAKEPLSNEIKARSDMGLSGNNEELEKNEIKIEAEAEKNELEKSETLADFNIKEPTLIKDHIIETAQNSQGQFWKYRKPTKHKHNNILIDYSSIRMSQNEIMDVSLERAANYNEYILNNRKKIKEITKTLERQKLSQRFALDNSNSVFPSIFIPLIRYGEETGEATYDNNACFELEKDSIQKYIELNVSHEHSTFEHPSKFAMFYPRRFPRRRRRRRNASKLLGNAEATNEPNNNKGGAPT